MRTLDRTVSIGLLTGKTVRVRPSVTFKRYIRDWFQPKCTTDTNCDIRPTPLSTGQLCKEQPETVAHILAGCPALAQNHYMAQHNAGLKCLYVTLLKHYGLVNKILPRHSTIVPKPEVTLERPSENLAYPHC